MASAGRRNNFDVIKEVRSKERTSNLVGNRAIDETSTGGLFADPRTTSWKWGFVERNRRQIKAVDLCPRMVLGGFIKVERGIILAWIAGKVLKNSKSR